MRYDEAKIGDFFTLNGRRWMVTDVGERVIVGIPEKEGWMSGPPYAVHEVVFDENDLPACEKVLP